MGRLSLRSRIARARMRRQEAQYWKTQEKIASQKKAVARAKGVRQLRLLKAQERKLKGPRISPRTRRLARATGRRGRKLLRELYGI